MKYNNKKVLLVYPEVPISYWSFKYSLPFIGKKSSFPPLGLLTVAAMLPESYQLKLIDMNVAPITERDISDTDIVFISAMLIQKKSFQNVVDLCNRLGKPVVAGGPYPTSGYKDITGVDYFVLNEAEVTLPEFIEDYENGKARKVYTSEIKPDITQTPPPRFDLINAGDYSTMMLQYSRGCPFNCEFCDIIELFGRVPRTKNPEQFVAEMDTLYQSGFRGTLFIVDDNFIGNKKQVKELLPAIIRFQTERNFPFSFLTEASLNLADDEELLDMMVDAGFDMVFLGIETPVEESLLAIQKKQNTKSDMLSSVLAIQKKGIEVSGGFIVGFDNDPDDIFDRQIDFIQQSHIPMAMVGLLTAIPPTKLYKRLVAENRMLKESSGNNTHDLELSYIPVMDKEKLIEGYKRVIKTIYKHKNYFDRCIQLHKSLPRISRPLGTITFPIIIENLRGLFLSFFRQLFSSYGLQYLGYLIRSLFTRPLLFPKAVRKAAMGHHFFKMTNDIVAADTFKFYLSKKLSLLKVQLSQLTTDNIADPLIKLLFSHKNVIRNIQKKISKVNNKPHIHIEQTLNDLTNNLKFYLKNLVQLIKEKVQSINFNHLKEDGGKLSLSEKMKIANIRRKYHAGYNDFKHLVQDIYWKTEEQIDKLIHLIDKGALVPVPVES